MFPKGFDHLRMYREYCVQFKTQMQKAYFVLKSFTQTQMFLYSYGEDIKQFFIREY